LLGFLGVWIQKIFAAGGRKAIQSFRAARCTPAFGRAEAPSARRLYGTAKAVPLTKQGFVGGA